MNGKLSPKQLDKYVLAHITNTRDEVVRSARLGGDTAVIKANGYIYMSTDPITASGANCGSLAVHICANDLAASGISPLAMLITILAPNDSSLIDIENVMLDCEAECKLLNMDIIGGHTEFTDAVNKIIISATAIGLCNKFEEKKDIAVGDRILVTKYLGLEGTAILVNDFKHQLNLNKEEVLDANNCLKLISVVKEGVLCSGLSSSMHDITEGGVVGALAELLQSKKLGAKINLNKVPFLDVTNKICSQLNLNKFKLLSSGSMLIITKNSNEVVKLLNDNNILVTDIGEVTKNDIQVILNGESCDIDTYIDNN